jgi:hypothetical protein
MCGAACATPINLNYSNYVAGPIPGNDNAAVVSDVLGFEVEMVGKFDDVEEDGTFVAEGVAEDLALVLDTQSWAFFFSSAVMKGKVVGDADFDYLAAKSGPEFYLFSKTDFFTPWHTGCHFISHVSLYKEAHVPEPGAATLCGLAGLGFLARRRR